MISIIVSSINEAQNLVFRRNVEETIGVDYELLVHDNRQTGWGLCKLYNHYAAQSRYDILCFFHEDILFHTQNWGQELVRFFGSHAEAGVVGFAGSTVKTQYISGWGSRGAATRIHLVQHFPDGRMRRLNANPDGEEFSAVALVDGLALITTKRVWCEHPFDAQTFSRFHLYDLDFSFQVAQHYTNYVCHTIDVEHLSNGSYTKEWFDESEKFIVKWKEKLPFGICPYPQGFIRRCEHFDRYKSARMRLRYASDDMSLGAIVGQVNQVGTFRYKLKLFRHIWQAGVKHIFSRKKQ